MSEHIAQNDMVEGQKTEIKARKIDFKNMSLQRHEITDKMMVTYVMDRNCTVEVIEKIDLSDEEIKRREPFNIFGEVGDMLRADSIRLFVAGCRNILKGEVKEGVSHRHGATVAKCSNHAIAKITVPWHGHLSLLGQTSNANKLTNSQKK